MNRLWLAAGVGMAALGRMAPLAAEQETAVQQLSQELSQAYFDLGVAYTELKAYRKAVMAFEKTLAFNPRHALAHAHLGLLYKHVQNDPEKAGRHLQTYLQLNPYAKDREQLEALIALLQRAQAGRSTRPDSRLP